MNEITKSGADFIGYEYKEVTVAHDMESIFADGYPNFGWDLEGRSNPFIGLSSVNLKFKRDRKIRNKAELTRLQRQFESNVMEIERLEQSKSTTAQATALTVGIIGTALLACATFAFIYGGMILLMALLAVPGFIGWFLAYPLFKRVLAKKRTAITPLIEQQYDTIYEVCEKAHGLLA